MAKINKLVITLVVGLFASVSASADNITLQGFSGYNVNGNIALSGGTNYHTGATSVSFSQYAGVGGFTTIDTTTNTTFQSWCVDIFHDFSWGNPGSTVDTLVSATSLFGSAKSNELGSLYTVYAKNLSANNSSTMNPAFQLAVWAIVNAPIGTNPSITGAGSVFTASTGTAADQQATELLSQIGTTQSQYSASVWSVNGNSLPVGPAATSWGAQDVVVFSPVAAVPEPETYAMLLAGLGLIGAAVKRRKAKQA